MVVEAQSYGITRTFPPESATTEAGFDARGVVSFYLITYILSWALVMVHSGALAWLEFRGLRQRSASVIGPL